MSSIPKITKDTPISEVVRICPKAGEIFEKYNMGCLACMAASAETLEEGALMHNVDVNVLVEELNAGCTPDG
jgi:hybrid cluster-associated redox disulfide protein